MNDPSLPFEPLAVVGMACRFPGADNLDEFWNLLRDARSAFSEVPADRLDPETYYSPEKGVLGKTYCRVAGIVPLKPLDRSICPLDPELASRYDPGHLVLCEVAAAACRHAGYDPFALPIVNTGVYVGNFSGGSTLESDLAYHSYARELAERLRALPAVGQLSPQVREPVIADLVASVRADWPDRRTSRVEGFTPHSAAALLTTAFGLTGPSLLVDAACASSLMSLLLAAHDLHAGRIEMALVAGAAYRKLNEWLGIARAQSMSARTSCPFDAEADGLITADGYGVVVVKTLTRALADGDRILGVVRGIGMSSDGRGKGMWAPRKEGQLAAISRAYTHGLDPAQVGYLEAHATSTQLGDATEVEAVTEFFSSLLPAKIPTTSVKANVGHMLETAGVAGLIKTLLMMEHELIPPAANFHTPSPAIDWDQACVYVPQTAVAWPKRTDGLPRRAGIDSFGIGGLNLHVVVDDVPDLAGSRQWAVGSGGGARSTQAKSAHEPIAIIGMGCLFPGALSVDAYWQLLVSGADPRHVVPADRWSATLNRDRLSLLNGAHSPAAASVDARRAPDPLGGFLQGWSFDWKKFKVPPKQVANINPLQLMLLDAAAQALEDAGYADKPFDRSRVATVTGTGFRSDFIAASWPPIWLADFRKRLEAVLSRHGAPDALVAEIAQQYSDYLLSTNPTVADETGSGSSSTLASRIAKQFDLMGGAMAIDAGDISAASAVQTAVDLLTSGRCDMVLAAAGQRSTDLAVYEDFALAGELAEGAPRAMFDAHPQGSVPGEGAGVLILKRLSDAQRDGDRIHAVIRGSGTFTDVLSAEHALSGAIDQALSAENIARDEVGLIEAADWFALHDDRIAGAIARTWGAEPSLRIKTVGSVRGQLGHLQGAGGMAALVKAVLEMKHACVPATFGLGQACASLLNHAGRVRAATATVPLAATTNRGTCLAAVSTFSNHGYVTGGGTSCQILLESAVPVPSSTPAVTESAPAAAASRDVARALPPLADGRLMNRFVLHMVDAPLPQDTPDVPTFHGAAIIVGRNPAAEALTARLVELGVVVYELPVDLGPETCVEWIDQIWQQQPAPHLFLMTARDEDAAVNVEDEAAFQKRCAVGVMLPYLVCQRWYSWVENHNLLDRATVVAATALGGDFGVSGLCDAVEGGGLCGLLKSLALEAPGLTLKVVDASPREPAKMLVVEILAELAARTAEVEVGYVRGRRQTVHAVRQQAQALPQRAIPAGSVWVVTGGARGVTAEVALELGRRYGLKLHLLGSSPAPNIDPAWRDLDDEGLKTLRADVIRQALAEGQSPQTAWNAVEKAMQIDATLARFRAAGVQATYHACDVAHRAALEACLAHIRSSDGPIDGVIHGAGDQVAARYAKKKPEHVARVLGAKLDGTAALIALTRDDPLKFFVAFGSTSGRFGGYVQTDYSLANDMLAKMVNAFRFRRPECASFTMLWTAWEQVGMAAGRSSEKFFEYINVRFMPPAEGIAHLIDELHAASHDSEILIVDHPGGVHSDHPSMPGALHLENYARCREAIARAPLVDMLVSDEPDTGIATAVFDPNADPFLTGHRDEGIPLLPAVMGIEFFCEAAEILSGRKVVSLHDYALANGLRMALPVLHRARAHLTVNGDEVRSVIDGDYYDKEGRFADPARQYQTVTLTLADSPLVFPAADLGTPPGDWAAVPYPDDWRTSDGTQRGTIFYGPALRALKAVAYDEHGAWGRIEVEPVENVGGPERGTAFCIHPDVLDAVLFGCDLLAGHLFGSQQLPHGIAHLWLGRMPKARETCVSRIVYRGREGRHMLFDFWLLGADGAVLYCSEGCRFIELNPSAGDAASG